MLTGTDIERLLATNDKAICRALVVLHNRQTSDEQAEKDAKYRNNRGFRPAHARMGSLMAEFYLKHGYLTERQINYWRVKGKQGMRIAIYWRQLLEEAKKKASVA